MGNFATSFLGDLGFLSSTKTWFSCPGNGFCSIFLQLLLVWDSEVQYSQSFMYEEDPKRAESWWFSANISHSLLWRWFSGWNAAPALLGNYFGGAAAAQDLISFHCNFLWVNREHQLLLVVTSELLLRVVLFSSGFGNAFFLYSLIGYQSENNPALGTWDFNVQWRSTLRLKPVTRTHLELLTME